MKPYDLGPGCRALRRPRVICPLGSLGLCVNCFDSRLVPQLMQLCEEHASPPFDGLSCLDENCVISCWHRGNLGFRRPSFCDSRFCQRTDTVKDLPGIEAALA